jgi:hypothetical protein
VHFTREPIIESVLSARDGFKLVLKNSKMSSSSEVSAEVIEIVSFSGNVFYRSQDRSKNFLLPASDYEVQEVKDSRLVLKNITLEKSNKLQNPPKESASREIEEELVAEESGEIEAVSEPVSTPSAGGSSRLERRRERRRNRRRRQSEEKANQDKSSPSSTEVQESEILEESIQNEGLDEGIVTQSAPIPTIHLIPPPTTLISQTLARYKEKEPSSEGENSQDIASEPVIVIEEKKEERSFEVPLEPEDLV